MSPHRFGQSDSASSPPLLEREVLPLVRATVRRAQLESERSFAQALLRRMLLQVEHPPDQP